MATIAFNFNVGHDADGEDQEVLDAAVAIFTEEREAFIERVLSRFEDAGIKIVDEERVESD